MQTALSYLVAARHHEIHELEQLNRTCALVRAVSELVHSLQNERGVANVYLASESQPYAARLDARIVSSELTQASVLEWLAGIQPAEGLAGGSRLFTRIAITLNALEALPQIRATVFKRDSSALESTERYNRVISALLALVFEAADVSVEPKVARLLVALFNLMQAKEYAGQERATGARAFASGRVCAADLKSLMDLIDLQEQCFARFEAFCTENILSQWQALQATMPLADIERMRRKLISPSMQLDSALGEAWFDTCTQRMDDIHLVEAHLTAGLQQACQARVAQTQSELEDQQALLNALSGARTMAPSPVLVSGLAQAQEQPDILGGNAMGSRLTVAIFDTLQTQTRHLQAVSEELISVRAALDERKHIERAKGMLMAHQSLSEEQAYRLLRQKAMNQNLRLVDVAQSVLSMAEFLPKRI